MYLNTWIDNLKWGATPEEVENSETWGTEKQVLQTRGGFQYLAYSGQLFKHHVSLKYYFLQESDSLGLHYATYYFAPHQSSAEGVLNLDQISKLITDILVKRYGDPVTKTNKILYPNASDPIWLTRDRQTSIRLYRGHQESLYIEIRSNIKYDLEHYVTDYIAEASERF